MERLKTDGSLNHCLIFSDAAYAKKADERKKGVGTEAQIISKEIYDSIEQTRFIPIVMELNSDGMPCLPTFLQSRKYIDFSSPEKLNQNWEKLVRLLHGKPLRVKPAVGPVPAFLSNQTGGLFTQTRIAFGSLRHSLMEGKPSVAILRDELLQNFKNELIAAHSEQTKSQKVAASVAHWEQHLRVQPEGRDLLIDWMILESKIDAERSVQKCVIPILECVQSMPVELHPHPGQNLVVDVLKILAYEMALYAVACLINVDSPTAIHSLLQHSFSGPHEHRIEFISNLSGFFYHSRWAQEWNSKLKPGWISPVSEKFKERATHSKITFPNLVEAEALIFIANIIAGDRWYPCSAVYCENGRPFRWFARARSSSSPDRLAVALGKQSWTAVRDELLPKLQGALRGVHWQVFQWGPSEYLMAMGFGES